MQIGKAQVQDVGGHAAEDPNEIQTYKSQTILDQTKLVHTKFYSRDWLTQSIIY